MLSKRVSGILLYLLILFLSACQHPAYTSFTHDSRIYRLTVKKLNDIILENNFPPVTASRNYVYANIAAYEVVAAGDSAHYRSLSGQIKELGKVPGPSDPKHIDFPFAAVLAFCYVGNSVTFPEGSMDSYVADLCNSVKERHMPDSIFAETKLYAKTVSDFIITFSKGDNYAKTRSGTRYAVSKLKGRWVPTPPMYGQALEFHWPEIRMLVADSPGQIKVPLPPEYNMHDVRSPFYQNALEVKLTGDHLSAEQKHWANFWDDNAFKMNVSGHVMYATKKFSPVGHWMNITGIATDKAKLDFNKSVSVYTAASLAIFDGFISCWYTKYKYSTARPETVINQAIDPQWHPYIREKPDQTAFDLEWRPYIQSPPFPEYTSAHAVISAAAAEVLTSMVGDHISYRDTSETEFGIAPLSFHSFREAAMQAAISRFLGGIHFKNSALRGNEEGKEVGALVLDKIHFSKDVHDRK